MKRLKFRSAPRALFMAGATLTVLASAAQAATIKPYFEFKKPPMLTIAGDLSLDSFGASAPVFYTSGPVSLGFEGISQYDAASFGRNFIPPDTNGAVGRSQYMEVTNGAYAVFNKTTGVRTSLVSDVAFWAAAGQTGANGDSRVMYNAASSRWMAMSFGGNVKDLQIAISDTDNALGGWKSVKFEGYAGLGFGATADYPTLALDKNAVYIGTNNFAPATSGGANSFRGTTLNVIPLNSLFNGVAPTTANFKQFVTPYTNTGSGTDEDRGFALQGVNSSTSGSTGTVIAASLFNSDNVAYKVNGLTASSAAGATTGAAVFSGMAAFTSPSPARQPAVAVPGNARVVDTLDERISSSVYEANGRIYTVQTVDSTADGLDEARVRYTVYNATTFAIVAQGDIGTAGYDSYMGSIAVNSQGQVVIGYNRSGFDVATGKISVMARTFNTALDGSLVATSGELLLKESLIDDYHNGSIAGGVAAGRQRWGDYSQVSLDPDDIHKFWVIGEFAREYNNPAGGHPDGTGGSRWGTYISAVTAVPEPATWAMMLAGFGVVGALASRRRRSEAAGQNA